IYATKAKRVSDEMFIVAARAVADQVTQAELDSGLVYPPQTDILQTEINTAVKICENIFRRRLQGDGLPTPRARRAFFEAPLYTPTYVSLVPSNGARA